MSCHPQNKLIYLTMIIRALRKAIAAPNAKAPYDRIHLKIFYPADNSQAENPFSNTPAARNLAPFPIVIFFNGFNCSLSMYQWLAIALAKRGLVVVLYDWLVETNQNVSLSPWCRSNCIFRRKLWQCSFLVRFTLTNRRIR